MNRCAWIVLAFAALLPAASAHAAVIETPSLYIGSTQEPGCLIVNTGTTPIEDLDVYMMDADGDEHFCGGITVPAGGARAVDCFQFQTGASGRCRVVGGFSRTKIRVTFCVTKNGVFLQDTFTCASAVTAP